jgi:ankyrin repeat protein/predicted DNA-binding WGR domain protein
MTSKRVLYKSNDLVAVLDGESDFGFEVFRLEQEVKAADPSDREVRAIKFDRDHDCEEQYTESAQESLVTIADILRRVLKISEGSVDVDGEERAFIVVARKLTQSLRHMASVAMRSGSEEEPSEEAPVEQPGLGKRKPLTRKIETRDKKEKVMDEEKSRFSEKEGQEEDSVFDGSRDEEGSKPKKIRVRKDKVTREQKPIRQPREPKPPKQKKVIDYKRGKFNVKVTEILKDKAFEDLSSQFSSTCCDICSNRECIRAANTNNIALFKNIIENKNLITTLFQEWGSNDTNTCLKILIKNNLQEFMDVFLEELKNKGTQPKKYYKTADSFAISQIDTGFNDKYAYGVATRKVALGRGNREGVNALCTDSVGQANNAWLSTINQQVEDLDDDSKDFWKFLMSHCSVDMFKKLVSALSLEYTTFFAYAVRGANVPLAAYIADCLIKSDGYGLNNLHLKALTLKKAEDIGNFRGTSVKKKSIGINLIFPIFCAAINPHSEVFIRMYESLDDRFIRDENFTSIIFYAALNENHEVLQYLLDNNTEYREANRQKQTPLMFAAMLGRAMNVELLMKKTDTSKKKSRDGYAAIHYAVLGNHIEAVRILLENGADVNLNGKDRMTPLAIASCHGYYEMAKFLLEKGAKVIKKDKFKRSPLILAIKNCHARVASLLLTHGCPFDEPDSSDNYPIHYACAYGCHDGLDILIQAGANPNVYNSWKLTPIAGAMMKNHYGIINKLLEYPDIDVNCKDDNGRTLLSNSIRILSEKTLNFARLIITKHKADITIPDLAGKSALHHLMINHSAAFMSVSTYNIGVLSNPESLGAEGREKIRIFLELVELLSGKSLQMFNIQDNSKQTALQYFFQNIPSMFQFNLVSQCPSTQTYDNFKRTYVKNLTDYHLYLDGDLELREIKYTLIRELLQLVGKYFQEAKQNSRNSIQDELNQEDNKQSHVVFSQLNEGILRIYISGFRTYIISKFFRSAMEFTSNQNVHLSFSELNHAKKATKRYREELNTVLNLMIDKLELSVQGKNSPPSAKSEILHFLSTRWSCLFNIPDDGKSALNILAQQNLKPAPTSQISSMTAGSFPQANQPFNFGQPQSLFGGVQPQTPAQARAVPFGLLQQGPGFGGIGFGSMAGGFINSGFPVAPGGFGAAGGVGMAGGFSFGNMLNTFQQPAMTANINAPTLKANCIDTASSGVNEAVYAEMKAFRKLQVSEREQITLDLLEFIRKSQESTVDEDWKDQQAFCQNILSMIPNIFYLNSVTTLELQSNENSEFVAKSCQEMIASNINICKRFISLAQLGIAECKAAHLGSQNSLFARFLELLPPILGNLSAYMDISQQKVDKTIISREIASRLDLVTWILGQFTLAEGEKQQVAASASRAALPAPATEFERVQAASQARVYQRSLADAFLALCESTFPAVGCGTLSALLAACDSKDAHAFADSLTTLLQQSATAISSRLTTDGVVYNKQAFILAVGRVSSSLYANLSSIDAASNQQADLSKRQEAAQNQIDLITKELHRRQTLRNSVIGLVSDHLIAVKGILPKESEETLLDFNRSRKVSDRSLEASSLWILLSNQFKDGLIDNIASISSILQYSASEASAKPLAAKATATAQTLQEDRCATVNRLLRLALDSQAFADHKLDVFSACLVLQAVLKATHLLFGEPRPQLSVSVKRDPASWLIAPADLLSQLLQQIFDRALDKSQPLSVFISGKLEKSIFDESKQADVHFHQELHEYLIEKQEFPLFRLFKVLGSASMFILDHSYAVDEQFAVPIAQVAAVEASRSKLLLLQHRFSVSLFEDKSLTGLAPTAVFHLPKLLSAALCQKSHGLIVASHPIKTKNNDAKFEDLVYEVDRQRRPLLYSFTDFFISNFDLRKPNKKARYLPEKLFEVYLQHGWMAESKTTLMEIFDRFFRVYGDMKLEVPKIKNPLFLLAENYYFNSPDWAGQKVVDLNFFTFILTRTTDPNIRYEYEIEMSKPMSVTLFDTAFEHRNPAFLLALLGHARFDQAEIFAERHRAALHVLVEFIRRPADLAFAEAYLAIAARDELLLNHRAEGFTPFLRAVFRFRELAMDSASPFADPALPVAVVQAFVHAGASTNEVFDDHEAIKKLGEKHPRYHLQRANALHIALNGTVQLPLLACLLNEAKVNPNNQRIGGNSPLHDLIEKKRYHVDAVKLLLSSGSNPNLLDDNLESCIFEAVRRDNLELIDLLVQHGASLNINNNEDMSPLIIMIKQKNIPGIEHLISIGSEVSFEDRFGRNSLHWAINFADHTANSSFEIEDILIKAGVEINKKDLLGRTPLHYPFVKIGSVTTDHMVDPIESVNSLLAKKNLRVDEPDIFGNSPLVYAAQRGSLVSALYLIDREADLDAVNLEGNSVLAVAMIAGHDHLAITLLNKGAKWNTAVRIYTPHKREHVYANAMAHVVDRSLPADQVKSSVLTALDTPDLDAEKKTPGYNKIIEIHTFRLAIRNNWQGLAYMFLSRGYDIGEAVFATIQEKKFNYTFTLLTKREENEPYQITDGRGDNLAHLTCYAASEVKRDLLEKIFRVLVRKGVSLHARNLQGHNALHCAAICGSTPMIQLLLEQRIDPDAKDEAGRTPMMLAAQNLNYDALLLLFDQTKAKNEQDSHGRNVLHYLCHMPNISDVDFRPLLERVSQHVDANEADSHGKLPLHYLLKTSTAADSQLYLLGLTRDVNARDAKGQSTVMLALKHAPTLELLASLLQRHAKLNGPDHVGRTAIGNLLALSHYSDAKKLEVLELILTKAQVDFNEVTSFKMGIEPDTGLPKYEKMAPIDYLLRAVSPSFEILRLLLTNGARVDQPNDAGLKSLEIVLLFGKRFEVLRLLLDSNIYRLPVSCDFAIESIDLAYRQKKHKVPGLCRLIEEKVSPQFIQILVGRGGNDINKRDNNGISAFSYAVSQREFSYIGPLMVGQLESKGRLTLDITIPDKLCLFDESPPLTTPLCSTIIHYQPVIAHILIANGASLNFAADPARPPAYFLLRDCHSRELFVAFLRQFADAQEFNLRCASHSPLPKLSFNFTIELPYQVSDDKVETHMVSPLYFAVSRKMPLEYLEEMLTHFPALEYLHPATNQSAFSLGLESYLPAAKRILRAATLNSPYCQLRKAVLAREDPRSDAQRRLPLNARYLAASDADACLPLNQLYEKRQKPHHVLRAVAHGADFNLQAGPRQQNLVMLAVYRNDLPLLADLSKLAVDGGCAAFDASAADVHGRTPIHAVVNSHKNGSFENVALLQLLARHYDVNKPDNNGFPPYYYAAQQDSGVMLQALTDLGAREFEMPFGLRRAPTSLISFATFPVDVPSYESDAEAYLAERERELKAALATKPQGVPVDSCVPANIAGSSKVMVEDSRPLDVYLTKVDIKKGQFGGNVFYRMQLLHEANRDVFIVVTRYGRIGDQGQHQLTSFAKREEALHEFCSIFKSKSGNDWKDAEHFNRMKKKYKLARFDQTSAKEELQDFYEKTHEKDLPESFLTDSVKAILREVASSKVLFSKVKNLQIDTSRLPLSRLNKADLMQAFTLLQEMKKTSKELQEERAVDVADSDPEKIFELLDELSEMTSDYFELIPTTRYRRSSIPPMEDIGSIDQNVMVVRELLEVEVAVKILLGARRQIKELHPLDYCYNCLNIKLMELDDQSVERSAILDYVLKSLDYGHPSAVKVFALERKGETERYAKYLKMNNRKLLWHGTKTMNFLGVLNRGLKIAPPEAPATGAMFGKGVYFSDSFAKAQNYCEGSVRIVLLCEVALGNMEMLYTARSMNQPSTGYDSVMGVGQNTPDPNQDVVIPNGMVIPLGPLVKRHNPDNLVTLNCNEFVVYNEDQVKIRYMVALGLPSK